LGILITSTTFAGRYERTKDGKTLVWNEDPKRGDLVTWSGARDEQGYATGYGTLTRYTPEKATLFGSFIGRPRHYAVSSTVSGTMVHGKLEETPTAQPTPKERANISQNRPTAPPTRSEATPRKLQVTPAPEKPASPTPAPTVNAHDSLDSLMHVPSSLKLDSPARGSPSPATPSPSSTPDMSLQVRPVESPSPSPY
jgi:hypothetical protein